MNNLITVLTIANSLTIIWLLFIKGNFSYSVKRDNHSNKVIWYNLYWGRKHILKIPIRNAEKLELERDIIRLTNPDNPNVRYTLGAICYWLKTEDEIKKFVKDYSVVNEEMVLEVAQLQRERNANR